MDIRAGRAPVHMGTASRIGTFASPSTLPTDDVRFRQFRNGRPHVYTLGEEEDAPDLHIHTQTLGHYSYVFYLADAGRRQIVDLMKRVRPKRPYLALANRIAASIGSFNAIHIRRGDFLRNELTKHKITRTTYHHRRGNRDEPRLAHGPRRSACHLYRRRFRRGDLPPDPAVLP